MARPWSPRSVARRGRGEQRGGKTPRPCPRCPAPDLNSLDSTRLSDEHAEHDERTAMRIAIAGGTGVVGGHAAQAVRARGHDVVVLARSRGVDVVTGTGLEDGLRGVDVVVDRSEEHTSELQSRGHLVCRLLL